MKMIRNLGLLLVVTSLTVMTSCRKVDASKGTPVENTVELKGFTGIDLGTSSELIFTEGDETSIIVTATPKIFEIMEIEIKNGTLEFDFKSGYSIWNADQVKIEVTAPNVNNLSVSGSGSVDATFDALVNKNAASLSVSGSGALLVRNITTSSLDMSVSGSGSIQNTNVFSTATKATISGSGELNIDGESGNSSIRISGSGTFKAFDFITDQTEARISGSGNGEVTANLGLDATISGSGSIYYKGNPQVDSSISGSGAIINAN